MSIDLIVNVSLQFALNLDSIAQIISGMTSEDFKNICIGIAAIRGSSKVRSV